MSGSPPRYPPRALTSRPSLPPIAAAASRADLVERALREAILSGRLRPGEQLVERTIAEQMQVSKTPVREALINLQAAALVTAENGRVIVRTIDGSAAADLYDTRLILEPAAIALAVPNHDEQSVADARAILERSRQHADRGAATELVLTNRTLHTAFYAPCRNELLLSMLERLQAQVALCAVTAWRSGPRWETEHQEHVAILDAIETGDRGAAEARAREHLLRSRERVVPAVD